MKIMVNKHWNKYISTHAAQFEADILQMSKRTVDQYVAYMTPHTRFGDDIMVIALCLYLDVSITLFQKGSKTINSCTFSPVQGTTKHVNLYIDLYGEHYDSVLSAPLVEQVPLHQVKSESGNNFNPDD